VAISAAIAGCAPPLNGAALAAGSGLQAGVYSTLPQALPSWQEFRKARCQRLN